MDCSDDQNDEEQEMSIQLEDEDQEMSEVDLPASPIEIEDSEDENPPVMNRRSKRILESDDDDDDDLTPKVTKLFSMLVLF